MNQDSAKGSIETSEAPVATRTRSLKRQINELEAADNFVKRRRLDVTTIEELPTEILLEIFSRMNQATLKASLLVNKQWEQIISQSFSTMKQLPLMLGRNCYNYDNIPKLTRKYQSVSFIDCHYWSKKLRTALLKVEKEVSELHLYNCIFTGNDFALLLSCFPHITRLTVNWCLCNYSHKQVKMEHLREMEINGQDVLVLSHIRCQLTELKVSRTQPDDHQTLVKFFNYQNQLESLAFDNIDDLFASSNQKEQIALNPKFQLRKLSLSNIPFVDGSHLLTLLKQAHNCETVYFGYEVIPIALKYVIKNCRNLKSIQFDAELLPTQNSFYDGLMPNTSLQHLKIGGKISSKEYFLRFLSTYPKVKSLDLVHAYGLTTSDQNLWSRISFLMKEVSSLSLMRINIFNLTELKFPLLTTLKVNSIGYTNLEAWRQLIKNCPNVERVTINSSASMQKCTNLALQSLKTLQSFELSLNQWFNSLPNPFNLINFISED